jgi:K+-sensing histidine kinase KdpD
LKENFSIMEIKNLIPARYSKGSQYFLTFLIIGIVTAICTPLSHTQNYHVVSFILLFTVSILSTFLGIGPVLVASTLSALIWNFFFIPPHHTFHIDKAEDILTFGLFFIIAFVNGILTTRIRNQELLARARETQTNALFQLTKQLSKASGIDDVIRTALQEIENHFGIEPIIFTQDGNSVLEDNFKQLDANNQLSDELLIARLVFNRLQIAGRFTDEPFNSRYTFFPLQGAKLNPGVIAIQAEKPFWDEQKSLWHTFLSQISTALEREFLGEMAQKVRFLDESDRLYKTLFNSISHELRIPVATIMGASDSIINSSTSTQVKQALSREIFTASLRLNHLIENLLNISRLESGFISLRLDWYEIADLFNKVARDLADEMKPFDFQIEVPENMPLIKIDFGLMERVLYNLLINSTQFSPAASTIKLSANYRDGNMIISIADCGPGFPKHEINNVFKKFFKVNNRKSGGLGLGLSIVKGFVDAHGGTINVKNGEFKGAIFTISIPMEMPEINDI